jgi:serine/threonine protein phosphatase PrpC
MKYRYSISTAQGTRKYNQDRAACLEGDKSVLLILGDGLGGHAGGDIAADLLVDTASRAFLKIRTPVITEPSLFLALILQHTHRAINSYTRHSNQDIDPRTTAVLCLVQNGYAYWAHAGDSRLYLFRNGSQLTRTLDHTGRDQARATPGKSSSYTGTGLFNCIGGSHTPQITLGPEIALQKGDRIMLCSDGVWQGMPTDEITEYLYASDIEAGTDGMLDEITRRHPKNCDNVTVLAFAWDDRSPPGQNLRHESIRDLPANMVWREVRESEQRLKNQTGQKTANTAQPGVTNAELNELDSILTEVESFVQKLESQRG